jgi:hypothetical protein
MSKPFAKWTVLPHGKLTEIEDNILTVVGWIDMPVGELPRRMTVVRLQDGRLVIFSAIALDEDEMRALQAWGTPAFLIVPSDHHRLDAKPWKERFPTLQVITPVGALVKVEKAVVVNAVHADFGDPNVVFSAVAGTKDHDSALTVTTPAGTTLIVNDVIGNIRDASGFGGWMLKLMGFAGTEPHIPLPIKAAIVDNKKALGEQLLSWAQLPNLRRIVMSHGEPIDDDPAAALRSLAASLA